MFNMDPIKPSTSKIDAEREITVEDALKAFKKYKNSNGDESP